MNIFEVMRKPDEYRYNRHVLEPRRSQMTRRQLKVECYREAFSRDFYHTPRHYRLLLACLTRKYNTGYVSRSMIPVQISTVVREEGVGL